MASTDLLLLGAGEFSFGFALQTTDLVTAATTGWVWLDAVAPTLQWEHEEGAEPKSSGQRGATAKKSVGPKRGTLAFRVEMPGQALDFAASSGNPVAAGAWKLVAEALGGEHVGAYVADGCDAGGAANSLVAKVGNTWKVGCAYAVGASAAAIRGIGFVKSVATVTGTLANDMRAVPVADDDIYPLLTLVDSTGNPDAVTFRLVGDHANADFRYVGCQPTSMRFQWDAAGRLWCDFEYRVYAGEVEAADGGLKAITALRQIDEYSGFGNAHLVIAENVRTALNDGAVTGGGVCGTQGHSLTIAWPHREVVCPSALERAGAVVVRAPEFKISFQVDHSPDWDQSGENLFVKAYRAQTPVPYTLTVGMTSGSLFGIHLPGALVASPPQPGDVNGAWAYTVELVAGANTGDGASTDAGNKPAKLAIG